MKFSTKFEVAYEFVWGVTIKKKRVTPILILFLNFRAFPLTLRLSTTINTCFIGEFLVLDRDLESPIFSK